MVNVNSAPFEKWPSSNTETLGKIYRIYYYKFTNKANIGLFISFMCLCLDNIFFGIKIT